MSKYIPFTTEQKERAASVDLEEFLRRRGEKLITSGRDKRLASDHSITIRGCEWFDHATEQGGRAISFVKQFYGLSYPDAMSLLLGDDLGGSYPAAKEKVPAPAKPFVLPPQSESMRRVYAYLLQKRCIDREDVYKRQAHFRDTLGDRRALRGYVVDEVKRTNGQIRFEDAQDVQRQLPDDTWRD